MLASSGDVRNRLANVHFWHCHTHKLPASPAKSYSPKHDDLVLGVASYLKKRKLPNGATPMDAYQGLARLSAKGYRNVEDMMNHLLFHNRSNYLWICPYLNCSPLLAAEECSPDHKRPGSLYNVCIICPAVYRGT